MGFIRGFGRCLRRGWFDCARHSQTKFGHQRQLLGALVQFGLPILALAGILSRQRGGIAGQSGGLSVGLLGRIDVLGTVEEPLMPCSAEATQGFAGRGEANQHCLMQPCGEDAIQHRLGQVRLLHADGFVVGLMVASTRKATKCRVLLGAEES